MSDKEWKDNIETAPKDKEIYIKGEPLRDGVILKVQWEDEEGAWGDGCDLFFEDTLKWREV